MMLYISDTANLDDDFPSRKQDLSSMGLANVMDNILKKQCASAKHVILAKTLTDKQIAHKRKIKETDEASGKDQVTKDLQSSEIGGTENSEKPKQSLTQFQKLQQERLKVYHNVTVGEKVLVL